MTPLRRRALTFAEHYPNITVLLLVGLLLFNTLVGAWSLYQLKQQQNQIVTAARVRDYKLCTVGNQARESLIHLLQFAEKRARQTAAQTGAPKSQVRQAVAFYRTAIGQIHIIHCPPPG